MADVDISVCGVLVEHRGLLSVSDCVAPQHWCSVKRKDSLAIIGDSEPQSATNPMSKLVRGPIKANN